MALPKANAGLIGRSATLEAEYETIEGEILKEGTVVEIREIDRSGVTIQPATCPTCGRSIAVSGISRNDLTLVKQSDIHAAAKLPWLPYPQNKPQTAQKQCLLRVRDANGKSLEYAVKTFNTASKRFFLNAAQDGRVLAWVMLD